MTTLTRVMLSLTAIVAYGWINFFLTAGATIASGNIAGHQFDNSDVSYVAATAGMRLFAGFGVPFFVLVAALVWIWWAPAKRRWKSTTTIGALVLMMSAPHAFAYYDKTNYAEPYFVLPNESAFFIPDVGANKDSQAAFGSEAYLRDNKIAAKRFEIPHVLLTNSGFWSNFYVPAGRLIIVDRTPYSREWVDAANRGTSAKAQGFPCQSKEGLDITVGMSIGTSVLEENSPRFLFRFGVKPPDGDRSKPEVIFQSVYYGQSLRDVMDGVVRNRVQTLVCDQLSMHTLNEANAQAFQIRQDAEKATRAYLESVGITLDFIGWADTFTFSWAVQKAIDDKYVADTIQPVLSTLQALADVRVKEGLAEGLKSHGLPANLITLPTNLLDGFTALLRGGKP